MTVSYSDYQTGFNSYSLPYIQTYFVVTEKEKNIIGNNMGYHDEDVLAQMELCLLWLIVMHSFRWYMFCVFS